MAATTTNRRDRFEANGRIVSAKPRGNPIATHGRSLGRRGSPRDVVVAGPLVVITSFAVIGVFPSKVDALVSMLQVLPSGVPAHSVATAPVKPLTGVSTTSVRSEEH